jgi:apolipoprotein N-acyltransferase
MVFWPEASTPFPLDANLPMAAPIRALAAETRTPFIIGSDQIEPRVDGPDRYYNAAVLIGTDGESRQWYRKMRLAPFGEYVPFKSLLFFVRSLVEKVSDFTPGTDAVVLDAGGRRVSVAICYESVYPSVAQQFVANGSTLLATITNDAWFGRTSAPYQHFELGAIRAVEQGRFVVRAANTGISGAVDPYGRVLVTTPLFEPAALTVDVRLLTERTIYSRTGDVVVWAALAVSAWLVVPMVVRRRSRL